jgi:hypothetical protein
MVADDHPVREVLKQVVADSAINADQVRELEKFVRQDWVIDEQEAKFLFRVNHALGQDFEDCPEWTEFFVSSIARLAVLDMNTPGQIDEAEGDWLGEMLDEYSIDNVSEKQLLAELQKTTSSIAGKIGQRIQPSDHPAFE